MESMENIRWKQRFENFEKAYFQLKDAVQNHADTTENLIKEGIIQRFEFTHELSWKVMKDFLEHEGAQNIMGSRSATKEAFNKNLISDGEVWLEMIETRNATVHTYQERILQDEFQKIVRFYLPLLSDFHQKMKNFI